MGRSSDEIRADIEQTRSEAAETVQAMTQKLDVAQRARDTASNLVQGTREVVEDGSFAERVEAAGAWAIDSTRRRPGGALAAAGTLGFIAGRLTKRRRGSRI
jgi:ElaB/YqjD/DUF883 family membrane-anchored ribosome-binding protein